MVKFNAKALAGGVIGAVVVAAALALVDRNAPPSSATAEKGKEQCYGVAKAGENGCAAANGAHSCSGLATRDNSGQEWKLVEVGTCVNMGGQLKAFENATVPASDETQGS